MTPKITFFCGSLEPGRDHIGDYTRSLAHEVDPRPGTMSAVALDDRYVNGIVTSQQGALSVLRIPSGTNLRDESVQTLVQVWMARQSPDWLSLQVGCWTHQQYGMSWRLGSTLRSLGGERPWHVMFHELWAGREAGARMAVLGSAQMAATQRLLKAVEPSVLHTSLDTYRRKLRRFEPPAAKLPLFGDLPIPDEPASSGSQGPLRLISLGSPPPLSDWGRIASDIERFSATQPIAVSVLGGDNMQRADFVTHLRGRLGESTPVDDLGFQDDRTASRLLTEHDVGLSQTAGPLIGTSSATISMLEHGLPIWAPVCTDGDADVIFRTDRVTPSLNEAAEMGPAAPKSFRPEVAAMFVSALK